MLILGLDAISCGVLLIVSNSVHAEPGREDQMGDQSTAALPSFVEACLYIRSIKVLDAIIEFRSLGINAGGVG